MIALIFRNDMFEIKDFKEMHPNKHCFIIASGPSLNDHDLSPLSRRFTIGLNRSFLIYPQAYYHCMFDHRLFEMYSKEVESQRKIFTLEDRPTGIPIHLLGTNGFSWDLTEGIYSGYTISYFALQLAVYMGFTKIFYLGLDLANDKENTHFFGHDYHSKNHDNTEYPKMINAFEKILPTLKHRDIEVYNCSKRCKATFFPYMSYEDAIKI